MTRHGMVSAYFDCFAGASGDMILGALVDAGLSLDTLTAELAKLRLAGYELTATRDKRGAISGTRVVVKLIGEGSASPHRQLQDILTIIEQSDLSTSVKERSASIFRRLAAAEARVHGVPVEEVHFHEVGAVDAIVDIVGSVAGLAALGVTSVYCSALPSGGGILQWKDSAHGSLPVPAPATLELIASAKAPLAPSPNEEAARYELVTPTGAAILTTLATFVLPKMKVQAVGYGIGTRVLTTLPNALRVWLGETEEHSEQGDLLLLETNIDDMNPELLGYTLDRLLSAGAKDVWFTAIQMKKNRPATMVSVLITRDLEPAIVKILLRETTTLGVRAQAIQRHEADREVFRFVSSLGEAAVKVKRSGHDLIGLSPEFEMCKLLAAAHSLPLQEVYRRVEAEARAALKV
ncbi:MAG: nickel pincer cofactor biosynthesis protein LarC [Dehalococcoidia bacterium]|nr:nickel pincer cofactor biosynthesis protein LarC [Dehalococcoidia bacterium]